MTQKIRWGRILFGCSLIVAGLLFEIPFTDQVKLTLRNAGAVIGRPLTPLSVAGVSRRTTRRMIRRTAIYVPVLPGGCSTVNINGTILSQCGGTYYQPYNGQYVVVHVY